MQLTDWDFERLYTNSSHWGDWAEKQDYRFENMGENSKYNDPPSYTWTYCYWIPDEGASIVLARHFLETEGHPYAILWDTCMDGLHSGMYVILTDYASRTWQTLP